MTYSQFVQHANAYYAHHKGEQRYGQAVFNYLYRVRPDLADRLRATNLDPFHKTSVPDIVWTFIANNW